MVRAGVLYASGRWFNPIISYEVDYLPSLEFPTREKVARRLALACLSVLKTVMGNTRRGSNPLASARNSALPGENFRLGLSCVKG